MVLLIVRIPDPRTFRGSGGSVDDNGDTTMNASEINLTPASLDTLLEYAFDSGNWSYRPYVSCGNVTCTKAMRGNLYDLVQKGLIVIHDEGTRE